MRTLNITESAKFTWSYNRHFFLETDDGNFEWSDPDYGGDGSIVPFDGDYKKWCKYRGIPYGRDKGRHPVKDYCGDVRIFWNTTLKCKSCGKTVFATGSDQPHDDYMWRCSNDACDNYKNVSHTGDMERPDWVCD
jgi:hypothetical protein